MSGGTEEPSAAGGRVTQLTRVVWPILCLFQAGLIAGLFLLRPGRVDGPSIPSPETPPAESRQTPSPSSSLVPLSADQLNRELAKGDDLLRRGRSELALSCYAPLLDVAGGSLQGPLLLRWASCLEGMGQWDAALAAYRKAVHVGLSSPLDLAADIGQARVALRRHLPAEARPLLVRLLLGSGRPDLRDRPLIADARYLLALGLAHESVPTVSPGPLHNAPLRAFPADWGPWQFLDEATTAPAKGSPPREGLRVSKQRGAVQDLPVQARQVRTPVAALIAQLAAESGLTVRWTPAAERLADGRSLEIALDLQPLREVLWAITAYVGLAWEIKEKELHVSAEEELSASVLAAMRSNAARMALRSAVLMAPEHPLAPLAYLELAALEVRDSKLNEAAAWYERALRDVPRTMQVIETHYSLGEVLRRLGRVPAALAAYYRGIDHAPGNEIASLALLRIGQVHLEQGEAAQAVRPLQQSLVSARGGVCEPAAAVFLAAAHLLAGTARAHETLVTHRDCLIRPPYQAPAAFLDALARYRVAVSGRKGKPEGGDLLSAVLALPNESLLGPCGWLLQGQAYWELGMSDRTATVFQRTLRSVNGLLAQEMTYYLARHLQSKGDNREARRLFSSVTGQGASLWPSRSRLALARLALQEQKPQECLDVCRVLLQGLAGVERSSVLTLMGRAYSALGENKKAARCFAGERPD